MKIQPFVTKPLVGGMAGDDVITYISALIEL